MIFDGLLLTLVGMGVVFLFLVLLILAMNSLARLVKVLDARFPPRRAESAPVPAHDDSEIAAAIVIARTFMHKQP